MQIIITGSTYLVKLDGINLKRCSFTYTDTTMTETVIENFGSNMFPIGQVTIVTYTLVNNVLTIPTMGQIFIRE